MNQRNNYEKMFQTELYLLFMRSCYIVGLSAKAISRLVDDTLIKILLVIIMMLIVVVMKMMMVIMMMMLTVVVMKVMTVMKTTTKLGGFDRNDNAY